MSTCCISPNCFCVLYVVPNCSPDDPIHRLILQFFCEKRLFVLTPWGNTDTDVYVPVVEHVEEAMIAARCALQEHGWAEDIKTYADRPFWPVSASTSRRGRRVTRSATHPPKPTPRSDSDSEPSAEPNEAEDGSNSEGEDEAPIHHRAGLSLSVPVCSSLHSSASLHCRAPAP